MPDHDEWRFGDEPGGSVCPVCGKANRVGQVHCATCGTPLALGADTDPAALRTIGEAMGGGRPQRRGERTWMWPTAVGALVATVAIAFWWSSTPTPHLSEEVEEALERAAPLATPARAADPLSARRPVPSPAMAAARPTARERDEPARPPIVPRQPIAPAPPVVAVPPPPVALATPGAVRAALPKRPARPPLDAATRAAPEVREQQAAVPPPPIERPQSPAAALEPPPAAVLERPPAEERPALGTDLVAARRAYRAAVDVYNARADAYNEVADEFQRVESGGDPERVAALRVRLDRARDAAEQARTNAESLRVRMEEVQAQYR